MPARKKNGEQGLAKSRSTLLPIFLPAAVTREALRRIFSLSQTAICSFCTSQTQALSQLALSRLSRIFWPAGRTSAGILCFLRQQEGSLLALLCGAQTRPSAYIGVK